MFGMTTAPNVKLWNTKAEFSVEELKEMRRSVKGITEIAERCISANGADFDSCVENLNTETIYEKAVA